jgi:phosphotransferase system  glucose/maltose/N-acetylglucosamine-specific IIC component
MVAATFIGWGFVTNGFASWLSWQGYFLYLIGGKDGDWAFANLGVFFALLIGFVGYFLIARRKIKRQEKVG